MRALAGLFMGLVGLVLAAPLAVVAGISLNQRKMMLFPPQGLSFQWYGELFRDEGWRNAMLNSLSLALCAALFATSVALPIAYAVWRWNSRFARTLHAIGTTPFILPPVITALGFLVFWTMSGFYGSFGAVVISHGIFLVTLPLITVTLGFAGIDPAYTEAAATLGADDRIVFRTVVLPMVLPYVVSGFVFAFVISLNEYIISYMVAGFTVETLPIKVFNSIRYGYTPVMAAVSVVFILVALVAFGLVGRFGDLPRLLGAWAPKD